MIYLSVMQTCARYERIISELKDERDMYLRESEGLRARVNEQVGRVGPGGEAYLQGGGGRRDGGQGSRGTSPIDRAVSVSFPVFILFGCYLLCFLLFI